MRHTLAAVILAASVATAAAEPATCRLSTADCLIVAREIANEEVAQVADERHFGLSLPPYERGRALIERHFARETARYPHIPVRIGYEWSRVELCDSYATHNAEHPESPKDDPRCH